MGWIEGSKYFFIWKNRWINVKISMGSTRIQITGTHLTMRFFQNDASKKFWGLFYDRYCMLWPFLIFLWPLIIFLINSILCPKMSWKSVWIYLKSRIEFWNLKTWLASEKVLSHLKFYIKLGQCWVVQCPCIQPYHVINSIWDFK